MINTLYTHRLTLGLILKKTSHQPYRPSTCPLPQKVKFQIFCSTNVNWKDSKICWNSWKIKINNYSI